MSTKDKEDLIERIAADEAELLNIGEICRRLKISRSTFERMSKTRPGAKGWIPFPAPDLYFGKSPRWDIQTFKLWIERSIQAAKTF